VGLQVAGIKLAARARALPRFAVDQTGGAEALEIVFAVAHLVIHNLPQRLTQPVVAAQSPEQAAEVVAKGAFIVRGGLLQVSARRAIGGKRKECLAD
jgi:hypothetical protein